MNHDTTLPVRRIPVILDTDIGDDIDDTWALALLLRSPELDVKLVTTATGDTTYRARLTARLLEVAGRTDVPAGIGPAGPVRTPPRQTAWVEGYSLERYPGTVHADGVQAMIDVIMGSPDPMTLISICPLTNIAAALRREPRIAARTRFVGMQGSIREHMKSNLTVAMGEGACAEWNVVSDIPAAQVVFAAPWLEATLSPVDTCARIVVDGERYQRLLAGTDPLLRALLENYRIWAVTHDGHGHPEVQSSVLFDCEAVHLAHTTRWLQVNRMGIRVDDQGYTREDVAARPFNVAMAWEDYGAFADDLTTRLLGVSTSTDSNVMEANLWKGREMPGESDIPLLDGVEFHLIKPYDFAGDGYRFLHGVAVAWHKGRLFASFGHNRGPENTATEEARGRVSDDGGSRWGDLFTIASAPEPGLAVSHGVFCSQLGELWAFHGAYRGTMEQVHTRAYVLDEVTGQWRERGVIVEGGFWPLQEPVCMADGNWIMAGIAVRGDCPAGGVHPPAVAISHGDDFARWDLIVIPCLAPGTVWGESTVFVDGRRVVNVARYGEESRALMAVSEDCGRSWSPSTPSNLPMATSKPYCGTLSDGRHYLIGTTTADGGVRRAPLTIALTRPGESLFSSVFVIRHAECPGWAVESHPSTSLSYPYAVEHEGKLYVGYSNNGGNIGRVGEGRELWNNNSAELAVIPIASLNTPEPSTATQPRRK